jgi:hypothetical protein
VFAPVFGFHREELKYIQPKETANVTKEKRKKKKNNNKRVSALR